MQYTYICVCVHIYAITHSWIMTVRLVNLYVANSYDFYDNMLWLWNWKPGW